MDLLKEINDSSKEKQLLTGNVETNIALFVEAFSVDRGLLFETISTWFASINDHLNSTEVVDHGPKAKVLATMKAITDPKLADAYRDAIGKKVESTTRIPLFKYLSTAQDDQIEQTFSKIGELPTFINTVKYYTELLNANPQRALQEIQKMRSAIETAMSQEQGQQKASTIRDREKGAIVTARPGQGQSKRDAAVANPANPATQAPAMA